QEQIARPASGTSAPAAALPGQADGRALLGAGWDADFVALFTLRAIEGDVALGATEGVFEADGEFGLVGLAAVSAGTGRAAAAPAEAPRLPDHPLNPGPPLPGGAATEKCLEEAAQPAGAKVEALPAGTGAELVVLASTAGGAPGTGAAPSGWRAELLAGLPV